MATILHVDDNEQFVSTAQMLLGETEHDISVRTATDAQTGLERLRSDPSIDCVVSDYDMPGLNGVEFLRQVRSEFGDLPFIMFTGEGSESVASDAVSAGVTDYVRKSAKRDAFTILGNRIQEAVDKYTAEQRARRRSEAIDRASDGIAVVGGRGQFVEVNEAYADLHDTTPDELLDSPHENTLVEQASDRMSGVLTSLSDGDEWAGDLVGYRADGSSFKKHVSVHRVDRETTVLIAQDSGETGEPDSFTRGPDAPNPTELVHRVGDALYAFDEDGQFSFVNQTFCEALAVDPEDILGKHFSEITARSDVDRAREAFETVADPATDTTNTTYEKRVQTGDGTWVPVETRIARLPGEEFRGVAGVVRDVSDRRKRIAQLEAQNERLDQVASYISHDLQTPLMTLGGCLSQIDTEETQFGERAEEAFQRIEEMIDGVSQLASEGWAVEETTELRIAKVANSAWSHIERRDATLRVDVPDDRTVEANESKLFHIFENLFKNAVDHCQAPTVTVTWRSNGFVVADDGPGIPDEERAEIFTPGYTTGDGSGLGLAHVAKIVEAHGWNIDVTDGRDGGTAFEIQVLSEEPTTSAGSKAKTTD